MVVDAHTACHPMSGSNQEHFGILAWNETVLGEHLACHTKPIGDVDAVRACVFTFPALSAFGADAFIGGNFLKCAVRREAIVHFFQVVVFASQDR